MGSFGALGYMIVELDGGHREDDGVSQDLSRFLKCCAARYQLMPGTEPQAPKALKPKPLKPTAKFRVLGF